MSTNAPAHCYGEQCIQYHAQQLANTSVPVGFLRDTISMLDRQANYVAGILEEVKVPHIKVLYERLFYAKTADEWMNIFRFVGVGPMTGLEMAHVRAVREKKMKDWSDGTAPELLMHLTLVLFSFYSNRLYSCST
jgi:hypothetical protein